MVMAMHVFFFAGSLSYDWQGTHTIMNIRRTCVAQANQLMKKELLKTTYFIHDEQMRLFRCVVVLACLVA